MTGLAGRMQIAGHYVFNMLYLDGECESTDGVGPQARVESALWSRRSFQLVLMYRCP